MGLKVAVTGSDTFFGRALVVALEADQAIDRILALDLTGPGRELERTAWHRLDLVHPRSGEQLAELMRKYAIDALVHTAFLARPVHRGGFAHELEAIGTRHVLAAAEATGLPRLVLRSTTLAYGARAGRPGRLAESTPLEGGRHGPFLADKVEVERQVAAFAGAHPERTVTVLRLAPLLGAAADTLATSYLRRRLSPTLLGFDPLLQFVHEDDAVEAARLSLHREIRGPVNVAAKGVVPLSRAIRLAGGRPVPLPARALTALSKSLWTVQLGDFPPGLAGFLQFSCVAELARMTSELRFTPRRGIEDAIAAFASQAR